MNITELLKKLESKFELKELKTHEDFKKMLKLEKVIIYFFVNWSGPERISRYFVYKTLYELDTINIPVYKIDCSDRNGDYVEKWLSEQWKKSGKHTHHGNGEVALVKNGNIDELIIPTRTGMKKVKEMFLSW